MMWHPRQRDHDSGEEYGGPSYGAPGFARRGLPAGAAGAAAGAPPSLLQHRLAQLSSMDRELTAEDYDLLLGLDDAAKAEESARSGDGGLGRELRISGIPMVRMPRVAAPAPASLKTPRAHAVTSAVVDFTLDSPPVVPIHRGSSRIVAIDDEEEEDCFIVQQPQQPGSGRSMAVQSSSGGRLWALPVPPAAVPPAAAPGPTSNEDCCVCREDMPAGSMVKMLPCLHKFHGGCIDTWLRIAMTCPICKHKVE